MAMVCEAALVFLFGFGLLIYEVRHQARTAVVSAGAALIVIGFLFLNLAQFARFSAFGMVTAEMSQTLDQAKATVEQLQHTAVAMGAATILALQYARPAVWDDAPPPAGLQQRMEHDVRDALHSIGITDQEINQALTPPPRGDSVAHRPPPAAE